MRRLGVEESLEEAGSSTTLPAGSRGSAHTDIDHRLLAACWKQRQRACHRISSAANSFAGQIVHTSFSLLSWTGIGEARKSCRRPWHAARELARSAQTASKSKTVQSSVSSAGVGKKLLTSCFSQTIFSPPQPFFSQPERVLVFHHAASDPTNQRSLHSTTAVKRKCPQSNVSKVQ